MRLLIAGFAAVVATLHSYAQAPDLDRMDVVEKSVPDGPVAKVSGRIIDREEFIRFYHNELRRVMRESAGTELPDGARAQLALWCVGTLIERELLHDEALERGVTVARDRVEKAWEAQLSQMQESLEEREGKKLSEEDILKRMGYSKREEVMIELERALVTEKMRAMVIREKGVTVSDEEVQQAYQAQHDDYAAPARMHLKQIYINPRNVPGSAADKDERALSKAKEALDHIYAGQRFESVAKTMSNAPDAAEGGDMGLLPIEKLPPFMVNAAMGMKPGEVSDVLKSEYGYHVIKLVAFEEPRESDLDSVAPLLRQRLLTEKGAEVIHEFCDQLIKNGAQVQVFLELEKNLALNGAFAEESGG